MAASISRAKMATTEIQRPTHKLECVLSLQMFCCLHISNVKEMPKMPCTLILAFVLVSQILKVVCFALVGDGSASVMRTVRGLTLGPARKKRSNQISSKISQGLGRKNDRKYLQNTYSEHTLRHAWDPGSVKG